MAGTVIVSPQKLLSGVIVYHEPHRTTLLRRETRTVLCEVGLNRADLWRPPHLVSLSRYSFLSYANTADLLLYLLGFILALLCQYISTSFLAGGVSSRR
jgi:hypothetical protein